MSNPHFSFYKTQSKNLNLDYPNILTNPNDFCFPKLYFSPLIQTEIECISKQLLIDANSPNKVKLVLNKTTKDALLSINHSKKHGNSYIQNLCNV